MPVKSFSNSNDNKSSSIEINKKQIPPTVSFKDSMEAVTSGMTAKQFDENYYKEIEYLVKNMDKLTNEELDRLRDLQRIQQDKTLAAENSDKENYLSSSQNKNVTSTDDGYLMPKIMGIGVASFIVLIVILLILFILAYFFLRYIKRKRLIKAQIKPVEPPTIPQPTIEKATSIDTSGLKFCIQCGKQIHGSSKFCPHCGAEQW